MINIRKRGNVYQYCFEAGKVNGKRKQITKSGFNTKNEAFIAGQKAYDEFKLLSKIPKVVYPLFLAYKTKSLILIRLLSNE